MLYLGVQLTSAQYRHKRAQAALSDEELARLLDVISYIQQAGGMHNIIETTKNSSMTHVLSFVEVRLNIFQCVCAQAVLFPLIYALAFQIISKLNASERKYYTNVDVISATQFKRCHCNTSINSTIPIMQWAHRN